MLSALKKNRKGILLMIMSSCFACTGQLLWKMSAEQGILIMLMGFVLYGVGALLMIMAYRFGRLSVLQPILSLNYVLGIVLAASVLGETITVFKIIGVAAIMAGVLFIAWGDEE